MSLDSALGGITSLTTQVQTGIGTVARLGADLGLGGVGGSSSLWMDKLRDAYYRGIRFHVMEGESQFGRRNVVHEYPFRDTVWVEDLGRSARRINVTGFLVGDDCIAKRALMINVCEQDGAGLLIHPTYGELTVNMLGPLTVNERWDKGRMFEIHFSFIESGAREFPSQNDFTIGQVSAKATNTDIAAAADFATRASAALKNGAAVVGQAVSTIQKWTRTAQRLSNDATNLMNLVSSLPGNFGRLVGSSNVGGLTQAPVSKSTATVASLIALGSVARSKVSDAASTLASAASGMGSTSTPTDAAVAAQALAAAVAASATDPADAIRLLINLAAPQPTNVTSSSPVGISMATMQSAMGDALRRAGVVSMARASSLYQPASVDDAVAVRSTVCAALDAEIIIAGDQYEDATYNALRALRSAVSMDLTTRGAGLPSVTTISSGVPMPALALAQRIYRDATRSDGLVAQSNAIHPAFMPTQFKALSL